LSSIPNRGDLVVPGVLRFLNLKSEKVWIRAAEKQLSFFSVPSELILFQIPFRSLYSSPEMVFLVGFDRKNRPQPGLGEKAKESVEIKTSLAHGQVLVTFFMIVVEMDFPEIAPEGLDPDGKGHPAAAESMVVTGIETESKVGRPDLVQETL
jgi:hypothetical protein